MLVDEAHAFGVLGPQGRGSVAAHALTQQQVPLRVIPLGKACAGQGAIVAGQSPWIKALLQAGRSFVYSTASSPAFAYGLLHTIGFLAAADDRRLKLKQLIALFQEYIKGSPLDWVPSTTPIQFLRLGCAQQALYYGQQLNQHGFFCSVIRSPTVPTHECGLRIILNYQHQEQHLQQLFHQLHLIYEQNASH